MQNKTKKKIWTLINWSLLGVIIALIFGSFTVYVEMREKKPMVIYEVVSESNVLDIHKPIKDLSISFRGENIQQLRQNLRIFTINVKNTGNKNIVQNDYDLHIPWGLNFKNAKLIEQPKIIDSNSEYIKDNLKPQILMNNIVEFSKIIFEHGKYFIIEIQVLHPINKNPEFAPIGKIAGVEKQQIIKYKASDATSFFAQIFAGSIFIQVIRALIFFIAGLALLLGIIFVFVKIDDVKSKRKYEHVSKLKNKYLSPLLKLNDDHGKQTITSIIEHIGINIKTLNEFNSLIQNFDFEKKVEVILNIHNEYDKLNDIEKYILPRLLNDIGISNPRDLNDKNKQYIMKKIDEIIKYIVANPIPEEVLRDISKRNFFNAKRSGSVVD